MKKLYFLLLAGIFSICAGCSSGPEEVLIDSFEGEISPKTVDFGSSEGSSLKVEGDKEVKICGEQSMKLEYYLKPGGYMWVARGYNLDVQGAGSWIVIPEDIYWKKYKAISLYMYSNASGGVIAFDLKDGKGELWRFLLDNDFQGWKEIICPFKEFFPREDWQPESAVRNEILDFPVMSFQFEPRLPGKGTCHFDCLKAIK
ncbi:MAG: carbohydrate binding domain-containing protein [Candidatus Omnitrophota bacterium]